MKSKNLPKVKGGELITVPPKRGGTITLTYNRRDDEGRILCCACAEPVPKGRQCWCSKECVKKYRDDQDWNHIRAKIIERDKNKCQSCGRKGGTMGVRTVHHIIPVEKGGTNHPDNLILLCERCHKKAHEKEFSK